MTWPNGDACTTGIEAAISEFHATLPGYWYTMGECDVSCHASCGPTKASPDLALHERDKRFDRGFDADIDQPSTLAEALRNVMGQALSARAALVGRAVRNPRFQPGDLIHWQGIVRRIDEVRSDGYVWSYPQYPAGADTPGGSPNTFLSVNSSDPEMTEWEKATTHPANGA